MSLTRPLQVALVVSMLVGFAVPASAASFKDVLRGIPIICSFVPGDPQAAPPPPPPPPPPPKAVAPDPCAGRIVLRGVNFDFDRAELQSGSEPTLDVAADQLKECPTIRVRVEGHTDSIGSEDYNQQLSERRAQTVKGYLQSRGLTGSRMQAVGIGESQPIASNATDDGRAQNRRVVLDTVK